MRKYILAALALPCAVAAGNAAVKLPGYLSDNMVIQRDSRLTVKGTANPGAEVKAYPEWLPEPVSARAGADGSFTLSVPTPGAGGPWGIDFSDGDGSVALENVLSGEVWLCSGQSNMEFPVKDAGWARLYDGDRVMATSQHPDLRLLKVDKVMSRQPMTDLSTSGWQIVNPASVAGFSAVAYLFGERLREELRVPVGVIDCSWGGTPAEAWTSAEALGRVPGFAETLEAVRACGGDEAECAAAQQSRVREWMVSQFGFEPGLPPEGSAEFVPFLPSDAATCGIPDAVDGIAVATYRLVIPADKAGKPLTLDLGVFDDEDVTFFNGALIGSVAGSDVRRLYSVDSTLVKPGENVITSYIADYGGPGGFVPSRRSAAVDGLEIPLEGEWRLSRTIPFADCTPRPLPLTGAKSPTVLYNAMVSPLEPFPVRGVIWYQGCDNVGRADQYAFLFPEMIKDWRRRRGAEFPFYFVQLAGFQQPVNVQPESPWAALRQAQAEALKLPRTGMASAVDAGNPYDIHPSDKFRVADRLARLALARDYGRKIPCQGPAVKSARRRGGEVTLLFDKDVIPCTCAVTGFILGDAEGGWAVANARQTGPRTIVVSSRKISEPTALRYNWADYPSGNLYGEAQLPVNPFSLPLE